MLSALFPHGVILIFLLFAAVFAIGTLSGMAVMNQTRRSSWVDLTALALLALVVSYVSYHVTGAMVFS